MREKAHIVEAVLHAGQRSVGGLPRSRLHLGSGKGVQALKERACVLLWHNVAFQVHPCFLQT